MPELVNVFKIDVRRRVKKDIPTLEGAWVEFYDDLLTDDLQSIFSATDDLTEEEKGNRGYEFVRSLIADWNFADTDEKKLDISVDNLKRLPMKVQVFLAKEAGAVFDDTGVKKELPVS